MHRFFCSSKNIVHGKAGIIDAEQLHHIRDVLRLELGEPATLLDENGSVYAVKLATLSQSRAEFLVIERSNALPVQGPRLAIACALPKRSKIDDIIDKLTQIGVERIIPMTTQRVVVRLSPAQAQEKLKRWQKIALSAVKQSQRTTIPAIDPLRTFEEVIALPGFTARFIPHLHQQRKTLKEALGVADRGRILVAIGPEGDFTPGEVARALDEGFVPVSLGENILRVETACLVAASVISYETH